MHYEGASAAQINDACQDKQQHLPPVSAVYLYVEQMKEAVLQLTL